MRTENELSLRRSGYFFPFLLLFAALFSQCDAEHDPVENWSQQFTCYTLDICNDHRGTRFGMIGDSWTDLAAGQEIIRTMRVQLEKDYGYSITGSSIGGQRLSWAHDAGLHFQVIENAGPDIKYMLISLGGNDLLADINLLLPDISGELNSRLLTIENRILDFVRSGDSYKKNRWGGASLVWLFHGYDYLNPDKLENVDYLYCRPNLHSNGFTDAQIDILNEVIIDKYNEMLYRAASRDPRIGVIDLRGNLGGPPVSNLGMMIDCIHPNTIGFTALTAAYVAKMRMWTGDEK